MALKHSLLILCLLCPCLVGVEVAAAEKTNVVFILTDNHGAWTLGSYGNPDIRTPHIDQLAAGGIRFSRAFANNPVCSPTRATYLTGLMPSQHGVHSFLTAGRLQIGPEARNTLADFTSLPEILKAEGYRCGLVGKWHLGDNLHPQEGLDDYWITMPHGGTRTFHGAEVIEQGETRTEPAYLTQLWTDHACKFIEANKDEPFFLYLAYNGPYGLSAYQLESSGNRHAEYYADKSMPSFPRGAIHPWQHANRQYFGNAVSIRRYGEELSAVDDGVGAVMEKLKDLGLEENTLVIFAADQGWAGGQHGLWGMGDHTRPVNAFEFSMHIPLIFSHPSGQSEPDIPGGRVSDIMVSNYDFMPTVLAYLGLESKLPTAPQSPGREFSGVLRGKPVDDWDNTIFYEYESLRCVRTENWKYVERFGGGYDELYHLAEDPGERNNLIGDASHTAKQAELKDQLDRFFAEYAAPEYDLWRGGVPQTRPLVWGKENTRGTSSGIDPAVSEPAITLPEGLIAEVAAAPPLTRHPMMGNFDDRGRLFIAEAAGVNRNAEELDVEKPNFIRMLVDSNSDGLFDQSTVFADGMTFPSGALWHDGALWVTAAPSIWRLEDTDDDGVADKREEVVTGFGYTGNAADLHGPFLHPNGRIFWCHGRKDLEVYDKDGRLIHKGRGARIWSCEPDGSDVQVYAGGGMDNPVEIDFTPEGEIVGSINLMYGRPRGDTLVHWQYGGVYPRFDQETILAEFKRTGDLLTEFHNFGHVAVSGMDLYRSPVGLGSFAGNLFTTHFNTQKITRTVVEPEGGTFRHVRTEDFLVIDDPDVHLTDVIEDADGTLLVVDTGGWFRNGCPASQIAKPEVAGAIYRIRKAGPVDQKSDDRGQRIDWARITPADLASLLGDKRIAVQERAIAELAKRGEKSLGNLEDLIEKGSTVARRNAVWALTRIGTQRARLVVRKALLDSEQTVRHTACNSVWKTRDPEAATSLMKLLLEDDALPVQLAAARALGRIGDPRAVTTLLDYLARPLNRVLEHATVYALMEINDFAGTKRGLGSESPEVQKRVLWALDGMADPTLTAEQVLPLLESGSQGLVAAVVAVCQQHPEWIEEVAASFLRWQDANRLTDNQWMAINELAPLFLEVEKMRTFIGRWLEGGDAVNVRRAFNIVSRSPKPVSLPADWAKAVWYALGAADPIRLSEALQALSKIDTDLFNTRLREIGDDAQRPALIRIRALSAISGGPGTLSSKAFVLLKQILGPGSGETGRIEAANLLAESKLTHAQMLDVVQLIQSAGPLELPILLSIYNRPRDPAIGIALVEALESSAAANVLLPAELKRMLLRYPPEVYDRARPFVQGLLDRVEQREQRLTELEPELDTGDPARGKLVFQSGKGACITCHVVAGEGREVGPDLTTIGQIRTKRDLLESILFPGSSLARDFEPYQIETVDGQTLLGVIQRETSDTLFLLDASATAKPIPRSSIKSIQPGPVSLMPPGLDQTMTREELIDLVAYLDSLE